MIDTIRLKSPYLDSKTYDKIKLNSVLLQKTLLKDNVVYWEFTNSELSGSYDSRIMVSLRDYEFRNLYDSRQGKRVTRKVNTEPYIIIECSLHKVFKGHNIFDGSDYVSDISKLISLINDFYGVRLPYYLNWEVEKIDYAKNYKLDSSSDVVNYINSILSCSFPRRERKGIRRYGEQCLHVAGSTTTLKIYNKGDEFKQHDKNKLKRILNYDKVLELEKFSENIIRFECSVKKRKLRSDGVIIIKDLVNTNYLENIFNIEFKKLLKEGESEMLKFLNEKSVHSYLVKMLGEDNGNAVFSTYTLLSLYGEKYTRSVKSKSTYYRHRKTLLDLNIDYQRSKLTESKNNNVLFNPFVNLERMVR